MQAFYVYVINLFKVCCLSIDAVPTASYLALRNRMTIAYGELKKTEMEASRHSLC